MRPKIAITLVLAVIASALSACTTPYQSAGFLGGYTDFETQSGVYYVSFKGNAFISKEKVIQYWHRRASEICGGRDLYEIIDTSSESVPYVSGSEGNVDTYYKARKEGYIRCNGPSPKDSLQDILTSRQWRPKPYRDRLADALNAVKNVAIYLNLPLNEDALQRSAVDLEQCLSSKLGLDTSDEMDLNNAVGDCLFSIGLIQTGASYGVGYLYRQADATSDIPTVIDWKTASDGDRLELAAYLIDVGFWALHNRKLNTDELKSLGGDLEGCISKQSLNVPDSIQTDVLGAYCFNLLGLSQQDMD